MLIRVFGLLIANSSQLEKLLENRRKSCTFDSPNLCEIKRSIMKYEVRIFIALLGFGLFACSDSSKVPTVSQPKENTPKELL
jgi:hypothetical protein